MTQWRVAGINFDHMHMGDLLRQVYTHPEAEIVGICHTAREAMEQAIENFSIPAAQVFTDYRACIEETRPDVVILCPATADHAAWTEKIAPMGVHILMEKPFAGSLAEADRMIAAMAGTGKQLAINWPLRWYPSHVTAKRLLDEGLIGALVEVHYYDGNRGPLYHGADKVEHDEEEARARRAASWFYRKEAGGGSLQDYLGYGATLGTWFFDGLAPEAITCMTWNPPGAEVDEHSVTIARYAHGLSKFETRWGTFTNPWTHQPQPKCGFVLKGTHGTLSSYDFEESVRIQTEACPEGWDEPVDALAPPHDGPINYFLHCIETGTPVAGPLDPAVCRIGQQIVDTAAKSAAEGRTLPLLGGAA